MNETYHLPTSLLISHVSGTYIRRSLILGAALGGRQNLKGASAEDSMSFWQPMGTPSLNLFNFLNIPKQHQKSIIFQHRPQTTQNDLTINCRLSKGRSRLPAAIVPSPGIGKIVYTRIVARKLTPESISKTTTCFTSVGMQLQNARSLECTELLSLSVA